LGQFGLCNLVGNNFYREIFGMHIDNSMNDEENFQGVAQVGALAYTDNDFTGLAQLSGVGNLVGGSFYGFLQVGGLGSFIDRNFYGFAQAGAVNIVNREFSGFAQVGAVNIVFREARGSQ